MMERRHGSNNPDWSARGENVSTEHLLPRSNGTESSILSTCWK
jgi:hypothetical protein